MRLKNPTVGAGKHTSARRCYPFGTNDEFDCFVKMKVRVIVLQFAFVKFAYHTMQRDIALESNDDISRFRFEAATTIAGNWKLYVRLLLKA